MSSRSLNVVLFGETGSGKSAVVNLLAGKAVAPISSDIDGCTKANQAYPLVIDGVSYTIWDTVGLEQPMVMMTTCDGDGSGNGDGDSIGNTGYLYAIEQLCKLIKELSCTTGVHLLLLCHRRGRITTTIQRNHTLLYEVACRKLVPVAVVVTHLEQEARMEDWWDQNFAVFKQRGIDVFGHACVTTLAADPKAQESREVLERLLGSHDRDGRYYGKRTVESGAWTMKEKDLVKILRERCGLRPCHARHIAQILVV